jgi:hypothetical protein
MGNWIGLCLFCAIGIACAVFGHWTAVAILGGLGVASFLTPVSYWSFEKSTGRLRSKSCNGLGRCRDGASYPLGNIIAVDLERTKDGDGGTEYKVRLMLRTGRPIVVSTHKSDATRISEFLGVDLLIRDS